MAMPVHSLSRLIGEHVDRRGVFLGAMGTVWLLYGASIPDASPQRFRNLGSGFAQTALNSQWWALLWVGCAAVAIGVGVLHARRWIKTDALGFDALFLPPFIWTAIYAYSMVAYLVTGGSTGDPRAWVPTLVWALLAFLVIHIAGWADPQWTPGELSTEAQ